jgi:hypothetical protein
MCKVSEAALVANINGAGIAIEATLDAQTVYSVFIPSNLHGVVTEFISDGATCGMAHMLIEEDVKTGTIGCTVPHSRECYLY